MHPELVAVIELTCITDLPSMLPAAFYQLSRVTTNNDFEGNDRA